MGAAVRRTANDELEALPEHLVGDIINGELEVSPRPRNRHGYTSRRVGRWLDPFETDVDTDESVGGWFIVEPELHLGSDILVPDIAGWRRARMPSIEDAPWFDLAPDWVCAFLSPSTARLDRHRKLPAYARAGVRHAWLNHVDAQTLEAYRLDGGRWLLLAVWAGTEVARIEPFETRDFPLARMWLPTARTEPPTAPASTSPGPDESR